MNTDNKALADRLKECRDWFDEQADVISKGGGSTWDLMQVREQRDLCAAALTATPSAQAGKMPDFQRWSMARSSDSARWSVYMDHDKNGEWVKWTHVQQEWFVAQLVATPQPQGDASPEAEPRRDDQLVDHWRSVSAEGNGHDVIANRNTVCRLIRHIDALAAAPQVSGGGDGMSIDPQLSAFYQVTTVAGLLAAQEEHIQQLQDSARRNVKPWEDTFPPTLLPKYLRDSGLDRSARPEDLSKQSTAQAGHTCETGGGWELVERLRALLPELEFSRGTHVEWRDCDQKYRDQNPRIGDAAFHAQCVRDYDERIACINEAIATLSTPQARPEHFDRKRFEHAPCYLCGYNGPGYYQPSSHSCASKYHGKNEPAPTVDGGAARIRVDRIKRLALDCKPADVPKALAQIVRECLDLYADLPDTHPAPAPDVARLVEAINGKILDWHSRDRLDQSDEQWMREKTYEQCADELEDLLAPFTAAQQESE